MTVTHFSSPAFAVERRDTFARTRPLDVVVCAAVLAVLFLQCLYLGGNTAFLAVTFALLNIVTALILTAVLWREVQPGFWLALLPTAACLFAALALGAMSNITGRASVLSDAHQQQVELVKLCGAAAACLSGALVSQRRRRLALFLRLLGYVSLVYVALCIWMYQSNPASVWGVAKPSHGWRLTGTLLNANAAACLFGMLAILTFGCLLEKMRKGRSPQRRGEMMVNRAFLMLNLILCLAAIALTQSRTGLALTLIFGALLAGVFALRRRGASQLVPVLLICTVIAAIVAGALASQTVARLGATNVDFSTRIDAYRAYVALIAKQPSGYGLGSFGALHSRLLNEKNAETLWNFRAAHSIIIQPMLEGGLLFTMALCAAFLSLFVGMLRRPSGLRSFRILGLIAAVGLSIGCSIFDIAFNVPAIATFVFCLMGLLWGYARVPKLGKASRGGPIRD